jgi:hypothetical protein
MEMERVVVVVVRMKRISRTSMEKRLRRKED